MDSRSTDFEELLACFNAKAVRAIVVGGHALAFHGRPRYTKDLDVLVEPTPENAERVMEALTALGFGSVGLTPDDSVSPGTSCSSGLPPGLFGAEPVAYLGRAEFLRNKRAAGRPQDLADVDATE